MTLLRSLLRDFRGAWRITSGIRSHLTVTLDLVILSRLLKLWALPGKDSERQVLLDGGVKLTYRLNRGDLCSLREVWIDEEYGAARRAAARTVVDLGANIGLATLWFARTCGSEEFVVVEPDAENARLLRRNLAANEISAEVVEAAAGPVDGAGKLARSRSGEPHAHRLSDGEGGAGVPVRVEGIRRILRRLGPELRANVLKVDVEGAEVDLFAGDTAWLERVDAVVIELHPWLRDPAPVLATVREAGFEVVPGARPELCAFLRA